jgi:hypothetical protein
MSAQADCQPIGRWRIVAADLWDRGHLRLGSHVIFAAKRYPSSTAC